MPTKIQTGQKVFASDFVKNMDFFSWRDRGVTLGKLPETWAHACQDRQDGFYALLRKSRVY
jgi:hypothetical protein